MTYYLLNSLFVLEMKGGFENVATSIPHILIVFSM